MGLFYSSDQAASLARKKASPNVQNMNCREDFLPHLALLVLLTDIVSL